MSSHVLDQVWACLGFNETEDYLVEDIQALDICFFSLHQFKEEVPPSLNVRLAVLLQTESALYVASR